MQKYSNVLNLSDFNCVIKSIQADNTKTKQLLKEVYDLKKRQEALLIHGSKLLNLTNDQVNRIALDTKEQLIDSIIQ